MSRKTAAEYTAESMAACPEEAKVIRKVIRALKAADNPVVQAWDGAAYLNVTTEAEIFEAVFSVDNSAIITKNGGGVDFVLGNGWDVISDYSTSLESVLEPVLDWAGDQE